MWLRGWDIIVQMSISMQGHQQLAQMGLNALTVAYLTVYEPFIKRIMFKSL